MHKSKIKLKVYPMQMIIALILMLLPMTIILEKITGINAFDYLDEAWTIFCITYVFISAIRRKIKRSDLIFVVFVIILAIIGLVSNMIFEIIDNWFAIAIDALSLFKIFLPYIVMKYIAVNDKQMLIAKYILPFAKLLILSATLFGILTELGFTNMYIADLRYGLKAFYFIFNSEPRFGYIMACCMLIVLIVEENKTKEKIYSILCIFNMILTTKGSVYIVIVCYIVFTILWKKQAKMTPIQAIPLSIAGIVASTFQINNYLRDTTSPRMLLLKYSFVTANDHFPFGSGFATYGSDMASRNYSPLYYKYRFHREYGLTPKRGMFLNDSLLSMFFAQFGYIGTAIFAVLVGIIFMHINNINVYKKAKALTLAIFIGLVASCLGSALIKSNIGVLSISIIGLVCGYTDNTFNKKEKSTRLKIKFQ